MGENGRDPGHGHGLATGDALLLSASLTVMSRRIKIVRLGLPGLPDRRRVGRLRTSSQRFPADPYANSSSVSLLAASSCEDSRLTPLSAEICRKVAFESVGKCAPSVQVAVHFPD